LASKTHAQGFAAGQEDAPGALDLQHEGVDRAGEIGCDRSLAVEGVIVDGGTG
jgi:hypothetical protein